MPALPYIVISIASLLLLVILAIVTVRSGRPNRITPLAGLAFALILAGILFGQDRFLGYGLIALGVVLAFLDIWNKSRGPVG
jgi:hypothetical protein